MKNVNAKVAEYSQPADATDTGGTDGGNGDECFLYWYNEFKADFAKYGTHAPHKLLAALASKVSVHNEGLADFCADPDAYLVEIQKEV